MTITYTENIFETRYRDDYADSDNFHRILFNNGKALQARELTQLQTIIQKQIERFGRNIFKEGATVIPGGITLNDSYEFVKLDTSSYTLPTDNSIDSETFLGQTSGVRVKVIEKQAVSGSDPATLYVSYTNTLNQTTTTTPIRLTPGEDIVGVNTGTVLTVQSTNTSSNPAVGQAVRFSVGQGFYFVNGFFVQSNPQSIILSKYSPTVTVEVGFKVTQDIVTVDDDASLYDNSGVLPNTTAAGADRFRIRLDLTTKDLIDSDDTFVYLAKIRNSEVLEAVTGFDQYEKINDLLALRTKEESGNYLVRPFKLSYDSDDSDGSILKLKVSEGTAYVNGYRAHRDIQTVLDVNRARDTLTIENEVVAADYGNYIVVNNLLGIPNFALNDQLNLRDNATYGSGSTIGTARVRAVDANNDGTHKIYLFKIEMNDGYYIRDIRSIGKSTTDNGQLVLENGIAVLKEPDKNSLIFKLPNDRPSNITDISFQVQRKFLASTDSSGQVGLSLSAIGETFSNTSDWIVAVDSSGAQVSPTITGAGTTSATITGAPTNTQLEFLAYVNKGQASQRTKTLDDTTALKTLDSDGNGLQFVDLGLVDVISYDYIRADSAAGADIAYKFNLDGGQKDAYYDTGRLVLKSGQSVSGSVAYKINHYLHSVSGDFFNVNSYSGTSYADIPTHTQKDGTVIDLRDHIDFRPTINSAGTFTGSTARVNELLKPTDVLTADVTYYLPRFDKIIINEQGIISVLEGISSLDPKFKEVPDNALELYRVKMNPYTDNDSDMEYQFVETKGYTMADIGKIEKRVDNLEEITALNLLELDTNSLEVLDSSGNNRTKSGFLVDNFVDHFHSATGADNYRASINPQAQTLNPAFVEKNVGLVYDSAASTNTIIKGDNVYVKYDEESYILQDQVSRTENVNPFAAFQFNGTVEISPSSDEWRDTVTAADRVIQGGNRLDTRQELLRESQKWNWNGVDANGETVNRTVTNETIRQVVDDRIIDVAVIPFMRSRKVYFQAWGLRPNTRLIPYFDEVDVSSWCRSETFQRINSGRTEFGNSQNNATAHPSGSTNLVSDAQGRVSGSFFIPNTNAIRFRSGVREFTLLDITSYSPTDSTTVATAVYSAEGALETRQRTIVSTRRPQPPRPPAQPRRTDPLAQSFMVHENDGLFVTKVRLYFSTKSDTMPVWVHLRPMVNGSPSSDQIIPGSTKVLNPSQVSTSADASVATDFEFDEPIYLSPNTEYAIVILADTTDYNVYTSKMGEFILNSTSKRITKQPFLGSFFKSQNAATWTPAQDEDLRFELFRADFDTVTDGQAYLANGTLANRLLDANAISTTSSSAEIKVAHKDHGFVVGDEVTISGVTGTIGGLAASVFNATHTITKVDGFGYAFNHSSNASSTSTGGGTAILANENAMFDVVYPYVQTISPENTSLQFKGKFHTGKSFAGSETPYLEDATTSDLSNKEENYFARPKVVANSAKETSLGTSTAKLYVDMTTSNPYVSPVLDLQRASLALVNNRVDKQAAATATGFNVPIDYIAETDANQGSHMSKHITKPVTLVNDAVGLKVLIGANRPSAADFQVYYKTLTDEQDINDIAWVLATKEEEVPSDENRNIFRDYRYLIGGQGGGLNAFNTFQIKIVFRSSNSSKVATIKDLRVIALGV
tara:strand:- start:1772 stop:6727 length:4956 start_codon:yes stop_codon:yes gene_type:complete